MVQSFRDESSGKVHPYRPEHIETLSLHVPHFLNTPDGVAAQRGGQDDALLGMVHGCRQGRCVRVYDKKLKGVIPIGFAVVANTTALLKRLALDKEDQQTPEGLRSFKGKLFIEDLKYSYPDPKLLSSAFEDMPEPMSWVQHGKSQYGAQICVNCGINKNRFDIRHISGCACCFDNEDASELLAKFLQGRIVIFLYLQEGQQIVTPFLDVVLHDMAPMTLPRQIWILKHS